MLPAVPAVVQVVDVLSAPELSDDDVMSKICSRDLVARPLAPVTKECEVVAALAAVSPPKRKIALLGWHLLRKE